MVRDYIQVAEGELDYSSLLSDLEALEIEDCTYFLDVKDFRFVLCFMYNGEKSKLRNEISAMHQLYNKFKSEYTKNVNEE